MYTKFEYLAFVLPDLGRKLTGWLIQSNCAQFQVQILVYQEHSLLTTNVTSLQASQKRQPFADQ